MKEKIVTAAQWIALAFFSVSFLAACDTLPKQGGSKDVNDLSLNAGLSQEQIVERRFNERWDAVIAKDYAKAYQYLSPPMREMVSLSAFESAVGGGQFKGIEFRETQCVEDVCSVKFFLTYDYGQVKGIRTMTGEKWFFQNGQAWFNLPED